MKIWFLTRSLYPYQKGGGPLIRNGQIDNLKELGWDITVINPNYDNERFIVNQNIIQIPFKRKYIQKLTSILERLGIYEDYLDKWLNEAFIYLKDKVKKEDIVFATSGGELGMIKLGSLLQKEIDCRFVVNFHDPLNYGYMNGLRRDKKFHIGREKAHEEYISNADLILTSSEYYSNVLKEKFTTLEDRIYNNYFGYIKKIDTTQYKKIESKRLRIAYVGTMGTTQKPELLYEAYQKLNNKNIELYFIGDIKNYTPLNNISEKNIHFIDFLPHDEFLKFMCENIDVGFVSLISDYFGACVPSKIYEYINLELPMIGALPLGDGKDIINNKNYGIACDYNDIEGLSNAIKIFNNKEYISNIKKTILNDKEQWYMKNRILEVDKLLRELK